ncbi:D-serine dehydratase [Rhizoctonia solani]|uniref:D-serine dehydratase n=1 Tax=Rhizoctonia solani TaxID=456999 RepID=A0A8H8NU15_9AGAM|nr:D-serine dehydratase [Rhizoctonia solani]QRW18323.1 D-serine dehydratase [Rhizoctonia solani]
MSRKHHSHGHHINLFTPGLPPQTLTPHAYINLPDKEALVSEFRGKSLTHLRTPALVIDRATFAENCARMHQRALKLGTGFRAHVKTHKTAEGIRLQLKSSASETHSVVVSTLTEAWGILHAGLVADGTVNDILYGLPISPAKIADLHMFRTALSTYGAVLRLMVDHPYQVRALEAFDREHPTTNPSLSRWNIFIKLDVGTNPSSRRAGVTPLSTELNGLLDTCIPSASVSVHGFYAHAGHSYASTSQDQAASNLHTELSAVNAAAGQAIPKYHAHGLPEPAFVLSVGATPTAHAVSGDNIQVPNPLNGAIELHAGNYPMLDSQQLATNLVRDEDVSQRVLASIASYYTGRGDGDEAMCDVGAIGMSKDSGPIPGFGKVVNILREGERIVWRPRETGWTLGRISQEHGILTRTNKCAPEEEHDILRLGDVVAIVGQHACLTAAGHPWYYIVDSKDESKGSKVVDVWVPWKGW